MGTYDAVIRLYWKRESLHVFARTHTLYIARIGQICTHIHIQQYAHEAIRIPKSENNIGVPSRSQKYDLRMNQTERTDAQAVQPLRRNGTKTEC